MIKFNYIFDYSVEKSGTCKVKHNWHAIVYDCCAVVACKVVMTSLSIRNAFRITGPSWGKLRGIYWWPVNSRPKGPVMKTFHVLFYVCRHKMLNEHSSGRWYTITLILHHCNIPMTIGLLQSRYPPETYLKMKYHEVPFVRRLNRICQSFSDIIKSTIVILPSSVQKV